VLDALPSVCPMGISESTSQNLWHFNHTIKLTHMDVISCQYLLNIMHILANLPQIRRPVPESTHHNHHCKKSSGQLFSSPLLLRLCMVVLNSDGEHVFM